MRRGKEAVGSTIAEAKLRLASHLSPEDWHLVDQKHSHAVACSKAATTTKPRNLTTVAGRATLTRDEPAIFSGDGVLAGWDRTTLTPRGLAATFPDRPLTLSGPDDNDGAPVRVLCATFCAYLLDQDGENDAGGSPNLGGDSGRGGDSEGSSVEANGSGTLPTTHTLLDAQPLCVFDEEVLHDIALAQLYSPPSVPSLGLRSELFLHLPHALRPQTRWLLLGPARSGTMIHRDPVNTAAWNAVTYGQKRWALLAPTVDAAVAERQDPPAGWEWSIEEWFDKEWPGIAAAAVADGHAALDFLQNPGEVVHVPPGWWHAVLNVKSSVAITHNFVHRDLLQSVVDTVGVYRGDPRRDPEDIPLRCRDGEAADVVMGSRVGGDLSDVDARKLAEVDAVVDALQLVDEDGGIAQWLRSLRATGLLRQK
eukprot:m.41165 g.41165  ORF g.41165 m.41165 type:complete len:423 (+) comp14122_c0_seq1:164-1432(+)